MIAAGALALLLAAPQVVKVEPPSWWPGHTTSTVRLLVRGRDLGGARLDAAPGLTITGSPRVSASGTSLLVDVSVDPAAAPGPRRLRLTTSTGSADVPFELRAPLPRDGRFQGFGPDDVVYLIMPDRFANGDRRTTTPRARAASSTAARRATTTAATCRGSSTACPT